MAAPGFASVAGGNVRPKRFVKLTGVDNTFAECGAGDQVAGISGCGTRNPPYASLDDGFIAIAGETFPVFGPTEVVPLVAGAAINAGERLKSDSAGRGTPVTANNDQYGAVALQDASGAGVEILVRVECGVHGA